MQTTNFMTTRGKIEYGILLLAFLALVGSEIRSCNQEKVSDGGVVTNNTPNNEVEEIESTTDLQEETESTESDFSYYILVENTKKLKTGFNSFAKKASSPLHIGNFNNQNGEVYNVFDYSFRDNLFLVGKLNKQDSTVGDITLVYQFDGEWKASLDFLVAIGGVVAATNPTLSAGDIIRDLGFLEKDVDVTTISGKIVRNGVQYALIGSATMIVFVATSPEE